VNPLERVRPGTSPARACSFQPKKVGLVKRTPSIRERRGFLRDAALASIGSTVAVNASAQGAPPPPSEGAIVHAAQGQLIPKTPDGRQVTVKIDSQLMPGVRMSMVTEDLPPDTAIRVHLHQHEDEIIVIRMGSGIATLGEREVAVAAGAIVYVPQGTWHGLRNNGTATLGMSAIYSPPGFEQAFKDRLLHPDRTPAEAEASRKKHGIVYRDPQR
jgi:mannose-6-phosphate isomerase-like protein (cupin superfamily)